MVKAGSEADLHAKLSNLANFQLEKGEKIVEFTDRIMELVWELNSADHTISEFEEKPTLFRGLPSEYNVASETVMSAKLGFHEAVFRLAVRETRVKTKELSGAKTSLKFTKGTQKCYALGKKGTSGVVAGYLSPVTER